jgi:cytosine/adenosine deaminase-related metal-dependent hydrolase
MGPHVTPDGALGGGRLSVGDVGGWLNAYVFHAETAFCLGRDLAATIRDAILRRVSGCGAARIHVSGMSDSWLRLHETDYEKHRAEL